MNNSTSLSFQDTFVFLETFEKGLNVVGYIPFVGSFSASVREILGRIEFLAGIVFSTLSLVQQNGATKTLYLTVGLTCLGHGCLNQIRALVEVVPGVALATALPYDLYATFVLGRRYFSYIQ